MSARKHPLQSRAEFSATAFSVAPALHMSWVCYPPDCFSSHIATLGSIHRPLCGTVEWIHRKETVWQTTSVSS